MQESVGTPVREAACLSFPQLYAPPRVLSCSPGWRNLIADLADFCNPLDFPSAHGYNNTKSGFSILMRLQSSADRQTPGYFLEAKTHGSLFSAKQRPTASASRHRQGRHRRVLPQRLYWGGAVLHRMIHATRIFRSGEGKTSWAALSCVFVKPYRRGSKNIELDALVNPSLALSLRDGFDTDSGILNVMCFLSRFFRLSLSA